MKLSRTFAGAVTAAAVAVSGLAFTAPAAHAAQVTAPTTTTLTAEKKVGAYGDTLGIYLDSETMTTAPVNGSNDVWAGTAHLQRKAKGSSTWTTISSDTSPGYQYFPDIKFTGNAYYRVYYQGAFYDSYPDDVTYQDSVSNEVFIKTTRNFTMKDVSKRGKVIGQFKASPKFGGKKFVFHKKVGKSWKAYKKVKANSKGMAKVVFEAKRGKKTWYRVTVPGDKQFTGTQSKFSAYKY